MSFQPGDRVVIVRPDYAGCRGVVVARVGPLSNSVTVAFNGPHFGTPIKVLFDPQHLRPESVVDRIGDLGRTPT